MTLQEIFAQIQAFERAAAPGRICARVDWSVPGRASYSGTITLASSISTTWIEDVERLTDRLHGPFPAFHVVTAEHETDGATSAHFYTEFVRNP